MLGSGILKAARIRQPVVDHTIGWCIDNAAYENKSFSVNAQDTSPRSVAFSTDGSRMYIGGATNSRIYSYTLSTPWDVSTAVYDSISFSIAVQNSTPLGIRFKTDGTRMFVLGLFDGANQRIYQYSLSTAWDVSTASYDSLTLQTGTPNPVNGGFTMRPNGTRIFDIVNVGLHGSEEVMQFSLSPAWDLTAYSYNSGFWFVPAEDTSYEGIFFKTDGTRMFLLGFGNLTVYQYTLGTAWNLNTLSYDTISFSVTGQDTSPIDLYFKDDDGKKMYMLGLTNKRVYQYRTICA